jgi:hypothetical protein
MQQTFRDRENYFTELVDVLFIRAAHWHPFAVAHGKHWAVPLFNGRVQFVNHFLITRIAFAHQSIAMGR